VASGAAANNYAVVFARSARKELERLSAATADRILRRIEALATNQRPRGTKKLVGSGNLWRLRVGDYRIVYGIDDEARLVDVIAVRHRKDAYQ
jgi:mRNA interferase RelE/StbE